MKKNQNPEEQEASIKVAANKKSTQFLHFLADIDEACMKVLKCYLMENKDQIGKKESFQLIEDVLLIYTVKNYEKDIHTKQKFKEVCGILHDITGFSLATISQRLKKKLCKVPIEDLKEHVLLGANLTFKNKSFVGLSKISTKNLLKNSEQFPNFIKSIQKESEPSEPVRYHEFNDFSYFENEAEDENILIYIQKGHNTIKIGSVKDRRNRELGINRLKAIGTHLTDKLQKSNKETDKTPKLQPRLQSPPMKKKVKKLKPIIKVEDCVSPISRLSEKTIEKKEKYANKSSKALKRAKQTKQINCKSASFLKTEQKGSQQIQIKSESLTINSNLSKAVMGKLIPRLYPNQIKNDTQNSDISEDCNKSPQEIKLQSQQHD